MEAFRQGLTTRSDGYRGKFVAHINFVFTTTNGFFITVTINRSVYMSYTNRA